ncbi:uncharacterized protein [Salminus brasiliensis]|uniref:uncharacterized protein n=1 Tax=Salminus brasiliensis TaxID=930266 RepID=UPI003B838163
MTADRRACCSASASATVGQVGQEGQEGQESTEAQQDLLVQALSSRELEMKNAQLRRKLSTTAKEKASLMLENNRLISELEDMQIELASYKTKVRVLGSKATSASLMAEERLSLEAEVESLRWSHREVDTKLKETQDTLAAKNELVDQLKDDIKDLKAELNKQTNQNIREVETLSKESMDLRLLGREQERHLEERNREVEECRAELDSLEAILGLLHIQDGVDGVLCANPCLLTPGPAGSFPNLKQGTGKQYQQLLLAFHALEQDRTRLAEVNHEQQERLYQVQDQNTLLQANLTQKEQSVQQLHTQLQETTSKLSQRDKELHVSLGQKQTQIEDLEKALSTALQEKQKTHLRADSLQTSLAQLSQKAEDNNKRDQEALRNLTTQAVQCAAQVKFLETTLSSCQEELSCCQKQMEETKDAYEHKLESKNREVTQLEKQLEKEKALASSELKQTEQRALLAEEQVQRRQTEAAQLSSSIMQLEEDMNKYRGELSEREKELLLIRRASGAKASQLAQMEKMLQETKGMLDKKSEKGTEKKACGDTMVSELEEKVQRSKRDRRNSLHRTQLLESQMKTVRGELVNTLDHLQALRDKLHRSQQKAEERKAAMEKLTAELREAQGELDHMRKEVEDKHEALKETDDKLQQSTHELSHLKISVQDYTMEMEQKLTCLQGALEKSARDFTESTKQTEYLTERLEVMEAQLEEKESLEQDVEDKTQQLQLCRVELQDMSVALQEMHNHCENLTVQLQESVQFVKEKEREVRRVEKKMEKLHERASQEESRLQKTVLTLTQELHALRTQHQAELHLSEELQHSRAQLDQANQKSASLLDELHTREQLLQHTSEALLLKESEVTRLKTRLSSIERSRELQDITQSSDLRCSHSNSSRVVPEVTHVSVPGPDLSDDPSLYQSGNLENNPQTPLIPQRQISHSPTSCLRSTLSEAQSKSF